MARRDAAGHGKSRQSWRGGVWQGAAGPGAAGSGTAVEAWRGAAGQGRARRGEAVKAWPGGDWQGVAGPGEAGEAWFGGAGLGAVRQGQTTKAKGDKMIYQPKKSSRISKEAAQVIGERIAIMAQGAPIRPEDVVDDARPESSPTHPFFEWDDQVAAEKYRLEQAQYYLRNIEIIREDAAPIRAFHVVTITENEEAARGYVTLDTVLSDAELLSQVIEEERQRLEAIAHNLAQYQALAPIVNGPLQTTITMLRELQLAEVVGA